MSMKYHDFPQGSAEWLAHRAQHWNASDAPAMMGCSPYMTRTELLNRMKTGISAEVDAAAQRRFDDGHRFEALARPLAEKIIGQELYPVTGTRGKLSASFDGLTLDDSTAWEHKTLSSSLADVLHADCKGHELPLHYRVQMEQQMLVSGAERVLFMASKWNGDELVEERHCWYKSDPELRSKIVAGWQQFDQDLAAFTPAVPTDPVPTGRTPENLPALRIEISGEVRASNLQAYREHALAVFGGINRELTTDQQFADAEKTVKWCQEVEDRLAAAKQHALSQTASIDELFRTIDDISAEARRVRLDLDKLVKARKEAIRGEIVATGQQALRDHIAALNARLGKPYMPTVPADFAGAIKGKRSIDSLRDAVDSELARAKIAASEIADRIDANLKHLREKASEHPFLFADAATIVLKAQDDLQALVSSRIADHERAEAARLERERERIRAEEQARADREARERQAAADAEAQRQAQAAIAAAATPAAAPVAQPWQAASVVVQRPDATSDTAARIKLGQINDRISPLSISADGLAELGFEPVAVERSSKLYREADFPRICAAIVERVQMAAALQAA